jgi:HD-like signal output (HDOD) protein
MLQPFLFEKEGKGTEYWVRRLTRNSMPVAGRVIAELNKLSDNDDADLNHLAELILRDPNLTSHVLRIANSVQYNVSNGRINTVSRAIVMIGLKGMRAVCISLMLIDSLLKNGSKDRMYEIIAQGFHAATQARALMVTQDADAAEEVFIAALLFNLGEMAYWASNDPSQKNEALLKAVSVEERALAANDVLGTSFPKITRGLAKQWKLGRTLEEALVPGKELSAKAKAVILGEEISRAALKGWDSPTMQRLIQETARYTSTEPDECLANCQQQAELALEVARHFGASDVCHMIPSRYQTFNRPEPVVNVSRIMKSDPQLQLNILRELTSTAVQKHNVNTIFQMVIEGIHRGIGMERVSVGFIKDYRVTARYSLGYGTDNWRQEFDFDAGPYSDNMFAEAVEKGGLLWVNSSFFQSHKSVRQKDTAKVLGGADCLIYVLEVNGKKPGLIYADRGGFGGLITQNHADSFLHFASQAQYNLQTISNPAR